PGPRRVESRRLLLSSVRFPRPVNLLPPSGPSGGAPTNGCDRSVAAAPATRRPTLRASRRPEPVKSFTEDAAGKPGIGKRPRDGEGRDRRGRHAGDPGARYKGGNRHRYEPHPQRARRLRIGRTDPETQQLLAGRMLLDREQQPAPA